MSNTRDSYHLCASAQLHLAGVQCIPLELPSLPQMWGSLDTFTPPALTRCLHHRQCPLLDTLLLQVCAPRQCNVGLLAYSPLAGGALSGKYIGSDGKGLEKARFNMFKGKGNR